MRARGPKATAAAAFWGTLLAAQLGFAAAPPSATLPPELEPVLDALERRCPEDRGEAPCAAKVDVTLPLDGGEEKSFFVLRREPGRLWVQAFRFGSFVDWGADGFGSEARETVDLAPYHLTQWIRTGSGREEAPPPGEDHYLGPLATHDGRAREGEIVLLRAARGEDREPAEAVYSLLLRAVLATLEDGGRLEILEPGRAYCWNEDGSPTPCEE